MKTSANTCPYCSTHGVYFCTGKDLLLHLVPGDFAYFRCQKCGALFQDPLPAADKIPGFYRQDYKPYAQPNVRRRVWNEAVSSEQKFGSVLDVGCGSGGTLASFHLSFPEWKIYGVDFSSDAIRAAQSVLPANAQLIHGDIFEILNGLAAESFDLIICEHVIEHVPEPNKLLQGMSRLLKPHGRLLLEFPNGNSLTMRILRDKAYHLDPPRHLTVPTLQSILALAQEMELQMSMFTGQTYPTVIKKSLVYLKTKPTYLMPSFLQRCIDVCLRPFKHILSFPFSKIRCVLAKPH